MSRTVIDGKYKCEWLPTQAALNTVLREQIPNLMYCGGFGCGKSRYLAELAFNLACAVPGIEIGVWRKTMVSLRGTTHRLFIEQACPTEYLGYYNRSSMLTIMKNGSRLDWLGMDNIQGKGSYWFDVNLVDESIEFEEDELKMMESRLRGQHLEVPFQLYSTNPGAPGSYQHTLFPINEKKSDKERDPDYRYFAATSYENFHNPASYFKRLDKWKGTRYYERYVLSKWTAFEGMVWDQYEPEKHLIEPFPIPANWPKYAAVDFGYVDPFVMLWIAIDPGTGKRYVYRQFYMTHRLVRDVIPVVRGVTEKCNEQLEEIVADHDAENRAQFEQDWRKTEPANKTVLSGIQDVAELFLDGDDGLPMLYIFNNDWSEREGFWYGLMDSDPLLEEINAPTCLQEEIPGYMWADKDKPVKDKDHACDALRYHVHTENAQQELTSGQIRTSRPFSRR